MTDKAVRMNQIVSGLPTKSAKIRALAKSGFKRSEIATYLECRYQFVRNVLIEEARKSTQARPLPSVSTGNPVGDPTSMKTRLDDEGRIVIPGPAREALGLKVGDALIATIENGELHLMTIPAAVRKAQAIVRRFVPPDVSLVDELLEDRRREVENEQRDDTHRS